MIKKQTVLEVKILQDPVPGWGHDPEDHVRAVKDSLPPWYKPQVKLIRVDRVDDPPGEGLPICLETGEEVS